VLYVPAAKATKYRRLASLNVNSVITWFHSIGICLKFWSKVHLVEMDSLLNGTYL
jgi:hypothetical protein